MCLAIPAKITSLESSGLAKVDILGITREISVDLTPNAQKGDYVLVHAGFAIEVIDDKFAEETIQLIEEFPELVENSFSDRKTNSANNVQVPAGASLSKAFADAFDN